MNLEISTAIARLAEDRTGGATALASRGLDIIEQLGRLEGGSDVAVWSAAVEVTRALDEVRPSMASIGAQAVLALARARRLRDEGFSVRAALLEATARERDTLGQANDLISSYAAAQMPTGSRIATCSFSMTALRAIVAVRPGGVWISEGGRLRDGARAAAWLAARGIAVEMVPDESLPGTIDRVYAVLVGADQILADGGLVNRAGTFPLALAAGYYGKPLYVACHRFKLAGRSVPRLDQEPGLLLPEPIPHVRSVAPLFDLTPAGLVHGVLTESGQLTSQQAGQVGVGLARLRAELLG